MTPTAAATAAAEAAPAAADVLTLSDNQLQVSHVWSVVIASRRRVF
jgi:hypothetical protein